MTSWSVTSHWFVTECVFFFVVTAALMSLLLQILRRLLQQLNTTGVTVEQQLGILLELEYLVHQVRSHDTHLQHEGASC